MRIALKESGSEDVPNRRKNESFQNHRGRSRVPIRHQRSCSLRAGGARTTERQTRTQGSRPRLRCPKRSRLSFRKAWPRAKGGRISPSASSSSSSFRPSRRTSYPVFFFKAKNGDLGYAPSASGSGQMETTLLAFFEFYQPDAAGALKPKFGGRNQNVLTTDAAGYSADKEDWYSFGLALPRRQVHPGARPQHARHEEGERLLQRCHPLRTGGL